MEEDLVTTSSIEAKIVILGEQSEIRVVILCLQSVN